MSLKGYNGIRYRAYGIGREALTSSHIPYTFIPIPYLSLRYYYFLYFIKAIFLEMTFPSDCNLYIYIPLLKFDPLNRTL